MPALVWPAVLAILKRTIGARLMSKWTGTGLGVALGLVGVAIALFTIWRVVTAEEPPPRYTAKQAAAACDSAFLKTENDALKEDLRKLAARLAKRGEEAIAMTARIETLEKEQDDARAKSGDPSRIVVPAGDRWLCARAKRTGDPAAECAGGR